VLSLELLFWTYVHQLRNEFAGLEAIYVSDSEAQGPEADATNGGYVYTIDPPAIFVVCLGPGGADAAALLNRMQTLAFAFLLRGAAETQAHPSVAADAPASAAVASASSSSASASSASAAPAVPSALPAPGSAFPHLRVLAFNDYRDAAGLALLRRVFSAPAHRAGHVRVVSKASLFDWSPAAAGGAAQYSGPPSAALVLHNNSDAFGQNIETEGMSSMDGVLGCCSDAAVIVRRERVDLCQWIGSVRQCRPTLNRR